MKIPIEFYIFDTTKKKHQNKYLLKILHKYILLSGSVWMEKKMAQQKTAASKAKPLHKYESLNGMVGFTAND